MPYTGSLAAVSNREDWQHAITLTDADSGEGIDISLCTITLTLRRCAPLGGGHYSNTNGGAVLTGSTATGEIVIASDQDGTFVWNFPSSKMGGLCQAQYEVGVRIKQDTRVAQLIIATIDVMEGIDQQ